MLINPYEQKHRTPLRQTTCVQAETNCCGVEGAVIHLPAVHTEPKQALFSPDAYVHGHPQDQGTFVVMHRRNM